MKQGKQRKVPKWKRNRARTRERGRENNNFFPVSHLTLEALQQSWINIPPSLPFFLFVSVFLYGSLTHAQVKSQALSLQDEKFCAERPNFFIYRAVARNSSVTGQKIKKRCYFVWEKWQLGNVFYLKIILCILCFEKVKKKCVCFTRNGHLALGSQPRAYSSQWNAILKKSLKIF